MSSFFAYLLRFSLKIAVFYKPCHGNFQDSAIAGLAVLKKHRYFLNIPNWQDKHIRKYKLGKLVSYFLYNVAKTCSYGPKMSQNIESKHAFEVKSLFHHSNFFHTSCFSAFKPFILSKFYYDGMLLLCNMFYQAQGFFLLWLFSFKQIFIIKKMFYNTHQVRCYHFFVVEFIVKVWIWYRC